jgi:hypothetical protein
MIKFVPTEMVRIITLTSYLVLVMLSPMQVMACEKMTDRSVSVAAPEMGINHGQMNSDCHKMSDVHELTNSELAFDCILSCASCVSSVSDMPIDFQKLLFAQVKSDMRMNNHVLPPHTSQLFRPPIV